MTDEEKEKFFRALEEGALVDESEMTGAEKFFGLMNEIGKAWDLVGVIAAWVAGIALSSFVLFFIGLAIAERIAK